MSDKIFKIKYLSEKFYLDYPIDKFPELELKGDRPYVIFVVKIKNHTFGIPFRTNIKHNYCYKFKKSGKKTDSVTGLDFSKAVVVDNEEYIGTDAVVDKLEFNELSSKIIFIKKKFENYFNNYLKYLKNPEDNNISKKYKYTTLIYFRSKIIV